MGQKRFFQRVLMPMLMALCVVVISVAGYASTRSSVMATPARQADEGPDILDSFPAHQDTDVPRDLIIVHNFSEAVNVTEAAFALECPVGQPVELLISGSGTDTIELEPLSELPANTECQHTAQASGITDVDGDDPPDNPDAWNSLGWSWTTGTGTTTLPPTPTATPQVSEGTTDPYLEPTTLEFVWPKGQAFPESKTAYLHNPSGGIGASGFPTWIDLKWGQYANSRFPIIISVKPDSSIALGEHEAVVSLKTGSGDPIPLSVKLTVVSADGKMFVNRSKLAFGGFTGESPAQQPVQIGYTGIGSINWTATRPDWVTLSASSGTASAQNPATLQVGINAAKMASAGTDTGTITISDGKTTHSIEVKLSVLDSSAPSIELTGLEVTQGVQNLLNDVPLVADRPLFVRAHVRSLLGHPQENVTAQLTVRRDGTTLGTLSPANNGGAITVKTNPARLQLNDAFLFELKPEWVAQGNLTLVVAGKSQPIACADPAEQSSANGVANDCTVQVTVGTSPALPIKFILSTDTYPVNKFTFDENGKGSPQPVGNSTFTATEQDAKETIQGLMAFWPLGKINWSLHSTAFKYDEVRGDGKVSGNYSSDDGKVLAKVGEIHKKDGSPTTHYYGLFTKYDKPNPDYTEGARESKVLLPKGGSGIANVSGFDGMGDNFRGSDGGLNAHEFGHNFGRPHAPCGPADGKEKAYPYADASISGAKSGNEAYYGFHIFTKAIYPPTHKDIMSYCSPKWVSDYAYKQVMTWIRDKHKTVQAQTQTALAQANDPIVIISGSLPDEETGTIHRVARTEAGGSVPAPEPGDYSLRLEDATGQVLASYPFEPTHADGLQTPLEPADEIETFVLAVPEPAGLATIRLFHNEQLLDTVSASATAPVVTVNSPNGGEVFDTDNMSIAWMASDADGDDLTYDVEYSTDGGSTWAELALGIRSTMLTISTGELPGSDQAMMRVTANDGFLTAVDRSDAVFSVPAKNPTALIVTTDVNDMYVGDQVILLEGLGFDAEDGSVSTLIWHSDRQGVLGQGATLSLTADDLVTGTHVISLEAVDRAGNSSLSVTEVTLTDESQPLAPADTVTFQVFRDRPVLPARLVVSPGSIGFNTNVLATEPITAAFSIANAGDGSLSWTVSTDSDSLDLSHMTGTGDGTVAVTIDPTDFDAGVTSGELTVETSDGQITAVPYTVVKVDAQALFLPVIER